MAQNITLQGASYTNVPAVELPKTGGGTALFHDVTTTTANAGDVAFGKYFFAADGTRTRGEMDPDDFLVALEQDSGTGYWEPTCTYAEVSAAASAGKDIVVNTNAYTSDLAAEGYWDSIMEKLTYYVFDYNDSKVTQSVYDFASNGVTLVNEYEYPHVSGSDTFTQNGTYDVTNLASAIVNVSGGTTVKTATGTFTGNGTRTIDVTCNFEPDIVYVTSDPGTTASSGTVALIIVRGMMTATRYRNNSTTNSHYAIPDITAMNTGGSSYSWRATYADSKVTLYCFSSGARALLTSGRTYSYTFVKYTS